MNRIDKTLNMMYIGTLFTAALLFFLFQIVLKIETSPLADVPGFLNIQYGVEVVVDLLTIGFIYLGLKFMSLPKVKNDIAATPDRYVHWAIIRCAMLSSVVQLGILAHYILGCPSTLACTLLGLLSLFFVWPTAARRQRETNVDN